MARKPPRRTRERILETALAMFNQFGEPTVATTSIAFEMGISPGNLYYHYHSKEQIVADLFAESGGRSRQLWPRRETAAERRGLLALLAPRVRGDLEVPLHLSRRQRSRRPLSCDRGAVPSHLAHKIWVAEQILGGLVKGGQMRAEPAEIATLAQNIVLVASYWMSFEFARDPESRSGHPDAAGAWGLSRHRARRAISRAVLARIVRSPGEALPRLRRTP